MRVGCWLIVLPPRYWTRRPPPPMRTCRGVTGARQTGGRPSCGCDQQEFKHRLVSSRDGSGSARGGLLGYNRARMGREDVAIVIMAKAPRAGAVKTRLCPPLSPADAADLYACFLR